MGGEAVRPQTGGGLPTLARALLSACHPEPAATVTLGAGVLSLGAGRGWGSLVMMAAIGSGQLAVGWSNDYLDRERDRASGRLDKPIPAGRIPARVVGAAAMTALVACIPLSLASGLASALTHLVALSCAFAYNAWLKTRPVSVLPYAAAFGLLPAIVTLGLPAPRWPAAWAIVAGALIGAGGHFAQVLPDIRSDRALGLRGLPQLLGERASAALTALLRAHMARIPFENLDVLLGRGVRIDLDSVHAKLVDARRGGYCFAVPLLSQFIKRQVWDPASLRTPAS